MNFQKWELFSGSPGKVDGKSSANRLSAIYTSIYKAQSTFNVSNLAMRYTTTVFILGITNSTLLLLNK